MDFLMNIFATITIVLNFSLPVVSKYCTYDAEGELRYYVCPRNEYCCNFGCCLSPTFQFYQLWYYWLMVIFMFLLCSGGGWWYRYWLQGRYGPELGTPMPPPSSRLHRHHLSQRPARVSYHPSRDAVVLHHVWKPRGVGSSFPQASPPPSYASAQRATTVSLPYEVTQTSSRVSNVIGPAGPKMSPYYQLYGPPPPYEAVVSPQHELHNSPVNTSSPVTHAVTQRQAPYISDNTSSLPATPSCDNDMTVATFNITTTSSTSNTSANINNSNNSNNTNTNTNIPAVTISSSVSNDSIATINRFQLSSQENSSNNKNTTDMV